MATIFAPSTGAPPAAIAIVRISGAEAFTAAEAVAGSLPPPRVARVRALLDPANGELLDRAIVLVFPGPATATGEDLVEFHLHGGRAVVAAVERVLATMPDLRRAEPGEFTRRALANGRIDLAEAEGLGDLLAAETELQRRAALTMSDGALSRQVATWRATLLSLAAQLEAALDFSDEPDVPLLLLDRIRREAGDVAAHMMAMLAAPTVERLRDGIHVVIAGPPNSGKSTLLNLLTRREAAIVSPIAGTTRDRVEVPVAREGVPFVITDTAGLRDVTDDEIERIGIRRADAAIAEADIVLWLGDGPPPISDVIRLHARSDVSGRQMSPIGSYAVSASQPDTIELVWSLLLTRAASMLPAPGAVALNKRQSDHCRAAVAELADVISEDEVVVADSLRRANAALARITGAAALEAMLDSLFATFCIGK